MTPQITPRILIRQPQVCTLSFHSKNLNLSLNPPSVEVKDTTFNDTTIKKLKNFKYLCQILQQPGGWFVQTWLIFGHIYVHLSILRCKHHKNWRHKMFVDTQFSNCLKIMKENRTCIFTIKCRVTSSSINYLYCIFTFFL